MVCHGARASVSMQHSPGARPHANMKICGEIMFAATRQTVSFLGTHIAKLFFFLGSTRGAKTFDAALGRDRPHENESFPGRFFPTSQSVSFLGTHIANLFFFLGLPFTCWHSGHRVGGPWKISCVLPGAAHPNSEKNPNRYI